MNRLSKMLMGLGLGVAMSFNGMNTANAADIPFDPDGTGPIQFLGLNGQNPLGFLSGLDWAEGNAVAVNSVPLQVGSQFTVHYQAKLSKFSLPGGVNETNFNVNGNIATAQTISGGSPSFEWTVNARFTETVVAIVGTTAFFSVVDDPNNYLKVFFDDTPDANNAAGTGFVDGKEILSASITIADNSAFTVNGTGVLDSAPASGLSVHGSGSFNINAAIDSWDEDFLGLASIGIKPGEIRTTLTTSTLELPFGPADPAAQFEQVGGPPVVPNPGPINGVTGPDFIFEADGNQVFDLALAVPEPATAALGVMALAGLALRGRRNRMA